MLSISIVLYCVFLQEVFELHYLWLTFNYNYNDRCKLRKYMNRHWINSFIEYCMTRYLVKFWRNHVRYCVKSICKWAYKFISLQCYKFYDVLHHSLNFLPHSSIMQQWKELYIKTAFKNQLSHYTDHIYN